jgi:hypothetical protein
MSCLFNSLAAHTGESGETVRKNVVDFLKTNPLLGSDIKTSDAIQWESGQNMTDYLSTMQSASTWGGALEISAFTQLYNTNVCVHNIRDNNTKLIRFVKPDSKQCYNISWNGGHFEPL